MWFGHGEAQTLDALGVGIFFWRDLLEEQGIPSTVLSLQALLQLGQEARRRASTCDSGVFVPQCFRDLPASLLDLKVLNSKMSIQRL